MTFAFDSTLNQSAPLLNTSKKMNAVSNNSHSPLPAKVQKGSSLKNSSLYPPTLSLPLPPLLQPHITTMNEENSTIENTTFLDHDYFSSRKCATASDSFLGHWHAVRAKHPDHQMLALNTYSYLKTFLTSKLGMKEDALLGSEMVPLQHSVATIIKQIKQEAKGDKYANIEIKYTCEDVAITLQNGVFQFDYKTKSFLLYVFHFQYGGCTQGMSILTWKDESLLLGKQLIADAYSLSRPADLLAKKIPKRRMLVCH